MPGEIQRPTPLYKILAERLAEAIDNGEFAPGTMLPSETRLMEQYGVSRPTARSAVAELRTMGLVESQHGKGSFVRQRDTGPALTLTRSISRTRTGYASAPLPPPMAAPSVSRGHLTALHASLLGREEESAAFIIDRDVREAGALIAHRTVIPFDVAEAVPALAEAPDQPTDTLYDALTAAGHTLTWTETVSARAALPDERAALQITDSTPVLITRRITADTEGRPLLLEELRANAATTQAEFTITPTKATTHRRS